MNISQKLIEKEIKKWRKILALEPQWLIHSFVRETPEEMSEGNEDALACIEVDLSYFSAVLQVNTAKIEEDDDLNSILLHELLHILIEPLSTSSGCGLGKKFEEMNTILTENTIEKLIPGYLYLYNLAYEKKAKKPISPKTRKIKPSAIKRRRK